MKRQIYRYFNQLRFKHKLFLSYLTVILIPISVLGAYAYNQSREMLDMQALQGIEKNVGTISSSIGSAVERYDHTIRSILYNRIFQKIVSNDYIDLVNLSRDLKEYLTPYFILMSNLDKDIEKVTFYTEQYVPEYGDSVLSAGRVRQERWYREAVREAGGQTRWFYQDGSLFVVGLFPELPAKHKDLVYMRINETSFFKNVDGLAREYGIMIVDRHGQEIYKNFAAAGGDIDAAQVMGMQEGMAAAGESELFFVKNTVPGTNWTIYCLVPAVQVSPNAGSILNATLIIIIVCIVTLLIIISIFSKTMISRIYKLNMLMKRVETGELDLRVRSVSKDEIGELTNGFGNMLVRLNELIEESYRSKIVQKEAELKALQWQINPHFLYNTLSFINWQALRSEADNISHVVTAMAKFYRTALNRGNNIISVKDELDNIMSYVEIIQVMGEHAFDVTYSIEEEVYEYATINLILQPLAENAIKHGISMKTEGRGQLLISAQLRENSIQFAVEDNGPGMPQETVETILSMQSSGYGLKNVNERLRLLFGAEYGISIESKQGAGTVMRLTIPQYKEEALQGSIR